MKKTALLAFFTFLFLAGCAGINFSQLSPDAKDFHPKTIAVMPATVGEHESSRDIIDGVVSASLLKSKRYDNIVDSTTIKTQISNSTELANELAFYIQKINTLGVSDPQSVAKLRESIEAEAILLTYVSSWGYGRADGNKVARVGLGLKLVDSSTGRIVWKASHELIEEYTIIRPDQAKMADKLMRMLIKEMPR
ncbi:MAG: hypothetical protein H3C68_08500 [Deltaproteobacteria bacterium]|nr:hypothetical protein [Deltaproteobacteria bacterium]MBZ0219408.1 hypothetical protein [Deltaproteobacteria bacterium]